VPSGEKRGAVNMSTQPDGSLRDSNCKTIIINAMALNFSNQATNDSFNPNIHTYIWEYLRNSKMFRHTKLVAGIV
jgi:hypothetical protein